MGLAIKYVSSHFEFHIDFEIGPNISIYYCILFCFLRYLKLVPLLMSLTTPYSDFVIDPNYQIGVSLLEH
jgi:hypothetical protein